MNVLSVGYPLFPVSCDASGGAEQILAYLDHGLVSQGHKSFVIAPAASVVTGTLFPTRVAREMITEEDRADGQAEYRYLIEKSISRGLVDLIHFHGLDFHTYLPQTSIPMLATLHLPPSWYPSSIFDLVNVQLNCVSKSQAAGRNLPIIPNGIDTDFFHLGDQKESYLLWLGRICPEKGVHIALQVALTLDAHLIVVGPVHPLAAHQAYFDREVAPLLDGKRVHIGSVGREQKRSLLGNALCLLVPSLVEETSSLVSMEAMSCGTPVIGYRSGALPEVIEQGVTGYIVDSAEEMAAAVSQVDRISHARCRTECVRRFDVSRMAREYFALYSKVMQRASARA